MASVTLSTIATGLTKGINHRQNVKIVSTSKPVTMIINYDPNLAFGEALLSNCSRMCCCLKSTLYVHKWTTNLNNCSTLALRTKNLAKLTSLSPKMGTLQQYFLESVTTFNRTLGVKKIATSHSPLKRWWKIVAKIYWSYALERVTSTLLGILIIRKDEID